MNYPKITIEGFFIGMYIGQAINSLIYNRISSALVWAGVTLTYYLIMLAVCNLKIVRKEKSK